MLHLHHSNQLEDLADQLSETLKTPSGAVMSPEVVAIPGAAISEWLTIFLARRHGVSANMQWLLPARLLWKAFRDVLPNVPDTNAFSADALSWRIFQALQDEKFVSRYSQLSRYLDQGDLHKHWQLARQMGRLFEQYLVFRPDWISDWEAQETEEWQGALWRQMMSRGHSEHWLHLRKALFDFLKQNPEAGQKLPARISLFALTGLSPEFLNLISNLAEHTDIHIYHLNFSHGFWADIVSDRERARLIAREGEDIAIYLDRGNRLLASMGRTGRQHLSQLLELNALETESYSVPCRASLLGHIQADITELRDSSIDDAHEVTPEDHSIQIHICHGPMREIEVLHDQLLDAFQRDASLTPADVRIFIPSLSDYVPFIDTVFGAAHDTRHIPWTLAESALPVESGMTKAFMSLLELPDTRLDAQRISALLDFYFIRRRFGLDDVDVDTISGWIRQLGIVWGHDAQHVDDLNLNLRGVHTWRGGIDRLLLGFGMGELEEDVSGVLPVSPGDSSAARALGQWRTFIEAVINLQSVMSGQHAVSRWVSLFNDLLDQFFFFEEQESDALVRLRQQIATLASDAASANLEISLPLSVVRSVLKEKLKTTSSGRFMSGAVTFANLAQGRCVPAQRVFLVGMNATDFPGRDNSHGLDQMTLNPKPGDRNRRDEDRFAFLEALMSARESFYVSYSGLSARDESMQPPSIVVNELLEEIKAVSAGADIESRWITRHASQPFSRRYFEGVPALFTYANELTPVHPEAAGARMPLFKQSLSTNALSEVSTARLIEFFVNPARSLLRDDLNITLDRSDGMLPIKEPMWPDYRAMRKLVEQALSSQISEEEKSRFQTRARLGGMLAAGSAGELALDTAWASAERLCRAIVKIVGDEPFESVTAVHQVDDCTITGVLEKITPAGQILWSVDGATPWNLIRAWCQHLLLNAQDDAPTRCSFLIGPEAIVRFSPIDDASENLSVWASQYQQGRTRPLPFFPRSALKFVEGNEASLKPAYEIWLGADYSKSRGEAEDPYFALAFRDNIEHALDGEFEKLAPLIFRPMVNAMKVVTG